MFVRTLSSVILHRSLVELALVAAVLLSGCGGGGSSSDTTPTPPPPPPGTQDATFGTGGYVATRVAIRAYADSVALQSDGKIVIAGTATDDASDATRQTVMLVRYTAGGSLDPTFGSAGQVLTRLGTENATSHGMAIQGDGKIVVVANGQTSCGLIRYLGTGVLDPTFGTNGFVPVGTLSCGRIALQKDGKIVVGDGTGHLLRFHPDGALDVSFGNAGAVDLGVFGNCCDIALAPDGRLVVTAIVPFGFSGEFAHPFSAIVRFISPDGTSDLACCTFDAGFGIGGPGELRPVVQADGKVVFTLGSTVHRLLPDGSSDSAFGNGGIATVSSAMGAVNGIALQANGKIVVVGCRLPVDKADMAVARFNSNGTLDTTFGNGGMAVAQYAAPSQGFGVAIQADGRIVAAGNTTEFPGPNVLLSSRFFGD